MGVSAEQIRDNALVYSRGRDKTDKSPEAFKIFINSLYVAMTRAIKNLYILEASDKHEILALLGLALGRDKVSVKEEVSSLDEWKDEARKLEMQGKQEQAVGKPCFYTFQKDGERNFLLPSKRRMRFYCYNK